MKSRFRRFLRNAAISIETACGLLARLDRSAGLRFVSWPVVQSGIPQIVIVLRRRRGSSRSATSRLAIWHGASIILAPAGDRPAVAAGRCRAR
jgi:hypothetical protein